MFLQVFLTFFSPTPGTGPRLAPRQLHAGPRASPPGRRGGRGRAAADDGLRRHIGAGGEKLVDGCIIVGYIYILVGIKNPILGPILVGGLEHDFYFSIYWECHHPNWRTHIFQKG